MPDYQEMYFVLFRSVTRAINILQEAQIKAEEMYISSAAADAISIRLDRCAVKSIDGHIDEHPVVGET